MIFRHALRAAIIPVVTIFGLDFATLLGGTVFTEFIFDIDGMGRWALDAVIGTVDIPVVTATVLVGASLHRGLQPDRRHRLQLPRPAGEAGMTAMTEPRAGGAAVDTGGEPYLVVENLTVKFPTEDGLVNAVSDLSYTVELRQDPRHRRRVRLRQVRVEHGRPRPARREARPGSPARSGSAAPRSSALTEKQTEPAARQRVAMIFQDALAALHPFYRVGDQLVEAYALHHQVRLEAGRAARRRSRRSTGSASRSPTPASTTSRTSSPAACGSA